MIYISKLQEGQKKDRLKILNTEHLLNRIGLYLPETYQDEFRENKKRLYNFC